MTVKNNEATQPTPDPLWIVTQLRSACVRSGCTGRHRRAGKGAGECRRMPGPQAVSRRKPDLGMRVAAAAKVIAPAQVSELLAVKLASFHDTRTPILSSHYDDGVIRPLVEAKLLLWKRWPGWGPQWRMPILTEFGERVLLSVAEQAMIKAGRMTAFEGEDRTDD